MSKFWSGLALLLSLLLPSLFSTAHAGQKIALDVYLADEVAFRSQHAYYMKDVFAHLFPDVQYRQILVPNSLIGLGKQATRQKVLELLKTAVADGETIQFLILDTHGNTVKMQDEDLTSLGTFGRFGAKGVDADFDELFSSIRHRTSADLTILLNSCSTFCGPPEESQKRAKALLDYFSAPNGRIYGAYVKEVDSVYLDPAGFKLKALIPSWKIYLTTMALFGAALSLSPIFDGNLHALEMFRSAFHGAIYFGAPFATLMEILNPLFSWFAGKTFANRGWLFAFQNGKLRTRLDVQKPRDMELILKGNSCSKVHIQF